MHLHPSGKLGFSDNTQQCCFKAQTSLATSQQQEKCSFINSFVKSFHGKLNNPAVTHPCVGLAQHLQESMQRWARLKTLTLCLQQNFITRESGSLFLAIFTHLYNWVLKGGEKSQQKSPKKLKQSLLVSISFSHDGSSWVRMYIISSAPPLHANWSSAFAAN